MEKYIWYNPETGQYEFGSMEKYEQKRSKSDQAGDFEIEYRFSEVSSKFGNQLTEKLNTQIQLKIAN